jgi:hypothetical protein
VAVVVDEMQCEFRRRYTHVYWIHSDCGEVCVDVPGWESPVNLGWTCESYHAGSGFHQDCFDERETDILTSCCACGGGNQVLQVGPCVFVV